MEGGGGGGSSSKKQPGTDAACGGGKPARTHWRRRDPADTAVYVVHPTQFRTVVQQLTGADPPPPFRAVVQQLTGAASSPPPVAGNNGTGPAGGGANAAAQQQQQQRSRGEDRSSGRTLGQMHQECMAWANTIADDC
ncbi:hypothetical protein HU200_042053 [Digitaria exilis]|uniref:VQ domain-containing protein n=1 Tax=Digitaria exilis TaxID=1010633 RepID=A0A835B5U5_9POAL|nr:hypothetical protein HU200_042053 [Digitaria exilis]